ncbi:MAG: hypothetical protein AMS27_11450 [Bacteroides sp. SM23_62_1]|nr:MAG: hypothetical protein AMS27_11450 [Bacteroides sp. SM23_62_1]
MKVHFYLDRRKGKAERLPIFMHFWYKGKLLRVFTGEHCDPDDWDQVKERILQSKSGATEINRLLQSMSDEVLIIVRRTRTGRRLVDVDYIRAHLSFIKGAEKDFFSVYDEFLLHESAVKEWNIGLIRRLNILRMHLKLIDKQKKISFYEMDAHFYERFIEYHLGQGFQLGYAARNLELLRWFMNWATMNGYNLNLAYKNFRLPKVKPEDTDIKYLTADELIRLIKFQPDDLVMESVKDIFCFGCLTGLRYHDMIRLGEENVKNRRLIYTRPSSEIKLDIPLVDIAVKIINKYRLGANGRIFPNYSIQRFNQSLKALGRLAGLNNPVNITKSRRPKSKKQTRPKWELLSSKLARQTFLKLGVEKGIGLEVMCEVTGNLPGTIRGYYHIESDRRKEEMQKMNISLE